MPAPSEIDAEVFTAFPKALRHDGPPSPWARQARPGQAIHSFLEGPAFDRQGILWLVDVAYGRVFRVDQQGRWEQACHYDGEPHGLALLGDGDFALTDHLRGLLRLEADTGAVQQLCPAPTGEGFRGLNDVACAPNGDLWFTDPGRSSLSDPTGRLFRLAAGGDVPQRVLANIPYPNSVALSQDGAQVFVAATRANAVWRLSAEPAGPSVPMTGLYLQLSGGLGPDGLAASPRGLLAVAQAQAGRVYLFDPVGDLIARIKTPGGLWTTAVAFDGSGDHLFIIEAQSGTIYRADVAGLLH